MRLSWNEIRVRAHTFSEDWQDASYEKGETQSFYNDFFQIFGMKRRRVATFEEPVRKLGDKRGYIDLFWSGVLLVEQKSAGRNLQKARQQAFDYLPNLTESQLPRYLLLCDFQTFSLLDLEERTEAHFHLTDLKDNVELFGFILGIERSVTKDQDPVNIEASELMGALYDQLLQNGYPALDLPNLLIRILFILFADDTGIFEPRGVLDDYLRHRTLEDGSDMGRTLQDIFELLDTPQKDRQLNIDEDLASFPYINGELFSSRIRTPAFNSQMREALLKASGFSWHAVSPAIFGSLFQSVMNKKQRRAIGAHYTTEENILKLLNPLLLDELSTELQALKNRRDNRRHQAMNEFREKLRATRLLDPACGCGNFLVIAYRELRILEHGLIQLMGGETQQAFNVSLVSAVRVDQFSGIELEEFPATIAKVSLWMMDHLMNRELSVQIGEHYVRIPLTDIPNIQCGNALRMSWDDILPAGDNTYLIGNPPFIGKSQQTADQKSDMELVFDSQGRSLDYVAAWFKLAWQWLTPTARAAFVSTNSITQGEQVHPLWTPFIAETDLEIQFAHRTFAWGSDARGKAHVHCVIIGFWKSSTANKRLWDYPTPQSEPFEIKAKHLTPYLIAGDDILVQPTRETPSEMPPIRYGNKPVDSGYLLLNDAEAEEIQISDRLAAKYIRPLVSAREYMQGKARYCLWLTDASPSDLRKSPTLLKRIASVRKFRQQSKKIATQRAANTPHEFAELRQPLSSYAIIPMHTSSLREYIPIGFFPPTHIVHNSCTCVPEIELEQFCIISSAMHMAWTWNIAGRIKSDVRYSNTISFNAFPWPKITSDKSRKALQKAGQSLLDARVQWSHASLEDLYDPRTMPKELRRAHSKVDRLVDRLYRQKKFDSQLDRAEFLLKIYQTNASK